jgi:hypothetical protein
MVSFIKSRGQESHEFQYDMEVLRDLDRAAAAAAIVAAT